MREEKSKQLKLEYYLYPICYTYHNNPCGICFLKNCAARKEIIPNQESLIEKVKEFHNKLVSLFRFGFYMSIILMGMGLISSFFSHPIYLFSWSFLPGLGLFFGIFVITPIIRDRFYKKIMKELKI